MFAMSFSVVMIVASNLAFDNLFFHAQLGQHRYNRNNKYFSVPKNSLINQAQRKRGIKHCPGQSQNAVRYQATQFDRLLPQYLAVLKVLLAVVGRSVPHCHAECTLLSSLP
jgi:hypothetical protein